MTISRRSAVSVLILLMLLSACIKVYSTPWGENVTLDAALYYTLATQYLYHHDLYPEFVSLHNVGFSVALAGVFWFFPYDLNVLSDVQRAFTVALSLILIPLAYMLCRTRFDARYSLIGAAMVSFEPHLIINSTLGVTEPLFLIFVVLSLYYSLGNRFLSGIIMCSLAMLVRFEGVVLFMPVLYLAYRQFGIRKTASVVLVAFIILIPVIAVHEDGIPKKAQKEFNILLTNTLTVPALVNSVLYMGWAMFPVFIWWIIPGLIKARDKRFMLVALAATLIPGLWAYLDAYDTRYFMISYPIVLLVSIYGIRWAVPYFSRRQQKFNLTLGTER